MAADTHAIGTLFLLVGQSIAQFRVLLAMESERADNAVGSHPYYIVPDGMDPRRVKPDNDGVILPIRNGPHAGPGELLILAIETNGSNTATDIDTTGAASDVYSFSYREYDLGTGQFRDVYITDESTRCTVAGVAPPTDPKLVQGVTIPTHAWGPVKPNSAWTVRPGAVRFDLRSAA